MTGRSQHLGEMLRSARESRGLDRERIERDTRIRVRYLSALERGAYDELPGDVYARGFLRTYARYLGLDSDAMVALYRIERRAPVPDRTAARARRPMEGPRPRAFALAPGVVGAALLTVMVGALVAYLAYQLITFARTPELRVLEPAGDVSGHRASSMVIRGVTAPNARVSVSGLAENPSVVADDEGRFSVRVELLPGSNLVTLSAIDPRTTRQSPEVTRRIEVIGAGDGGESRRPPSAQQG